MPTACTMSTATMMIVVSRPSSWSAYVADSAMTVWMPSL